MKTVSDNLIQLGEDKFASEGKRTLAFAIIDMAIVRLITLIIVFPLLSNYRLDKDVTELFVASVFFLVYWLYFSCMESSTWQATLGMKLFKIKVTTLDGQRLTFSKATIRSLGRILSISLAGIGILMIVFTKNKQSFHDYITGSIVVKKDCKP